MSRKLELQKASSKQAKIIQIPTRLMDEYIRQLQVRLREKKIGYKKEFLREIVKQLRIRVSEITLSYRLPMTVRTPSAHVKNPRAGEFFTVSNGGADGSRTHGL